MLLVICGSEGRGGWQGSGGVVGWGGLGGRGFCFFWGGGQEEAK